MKVLHVNDVANVGSNLVRGLRELGVGADLLLVPKKLRTSTRKDNALLPLRRVRVARELRRLVREEKYDVVHVHFAAHAYLAWMAGVPYYLHVHGTDVRTYSHIPVVGRLYRFAVQKAVRVFYVTPDLAQHVKQLRSDGIFLPNPVDVDLFSPRESKEPQQSRILCVSKLDRYKGVNSFLRAVELVWQARPDTQVSMFSFGNASETAASFLDKYGDDPRLTLLAPVPHDEMPSLVASSSVILGHQSHEYGSLSCSELEAMACGRTVICRLRYVHAYPTRPPVLTSHTPEEACARLVRILDDPGSGASLGCSARNWVVEHHRPAHVAHTLLAVYHQAEREA